MLAAVDGVRAAQRRIRLAAGAHKLARPVYSLLTKGEEFSDQGQAYYEERYRQRVLHNLNKLAQQLGMTLVPTAPTVQAA